QSVVVGIISRCSWVARPGWAAGWWLGGFRGRDNKVAVVAAILGVLGGCVSPRSLHRRQATGKLATGQPSGFCGRLCIPDEEAAAGVALVVGFEVGFEVRHDREARCQGDVATLHSDADAMGLNLSGHFVFLSEFRQHRAAMNEL